MMLGKLLKGLKGRDRHLAWNRTEPTAATLILTSSAFADGGPIGLRHAAIAGGRNLSPPLAIQGVPDAAQDLLLVLEDPDVPLPRPVVHMIVRLPPKTHSLAEGALNLGESVDFGCGSFGRRGYHGPRPFPGHGPHRYVFELFAVSRALNLGPKARLADYLEVMHGHLMARGRLTGTFER
jgi:Raf kinase inhibitor-like YbhB/YbcL family protein